MGKIGAILLSGLMSAALVGCDSSEKTGETASKVGETDGSQVSNEKENFKSYLADVRPVTQDLSQVGKDFDTLRQESIDGEIDDLTFRSRVTEKFLPESVEMQEPIEQIIPPKELRNTHAKMIKMMAKNTEGLSEIISAIDTGDASKLTSANNLMTETRTTAREYMYDLQDLADKYAVSMK
jgi:hypothetical protein